VFEGDIPSDCKPADAISLFASPDNIRRYEEAPWFSSLRFSIVLIPENGGERNTVSAGKMRELACPFYPHDLNTLLEEIKHER
jgi:hypothetical protein